MSWADTVTCGPTLLGCLKLRVILDARLSGPSISSAEAPCMCMGAAGRNAVTPAGHARVSYMEAAAGVASKGEHASASAVVSGVPG